MALLFSLMKLLTVGLEQLAVGEKSLVGKLGLVLELDPIPCLVLKLDPVPCLMVLYYVLKQHNFYGIFCIFRGEFTFANHCVNVGTGGVDAFICWRSERISSW